MKTNLKLSSKMHLFIIISSVLIALGIMVGVICHFVANGYFNYGGDWASYKEVTVSYAYVDYSDENEVIEMCNEKFSTAGLKYQSLTKGKSAEGGEIVYAFSVATNGNNLDAALILINDAIAEKVGGAAQTTVSVHTREALLGGALTIERCCIALACIIIVHFLYFVIRYKLTMALAAVLADIHNLGIFLSLLSLTRIPVASSVLAFAAITLLITVIGTSLLFDRMRKNAKNEDLKKLSVFEHADLGANECLKLNLIIPACLASVAALLFVLLSISSLSPIVIIAPVFGALVSFISCAYGTVFFTPSVYSRFKLLGDNYKSKHVRATKTKSTNK